MGIVFQNPQYLWLLAALPVMVFVHFFSLRSRKKSALSFANFEAIARVKGVEFVSRNLTMLVVALLAVSSLSLSLAGMGVRQNLVSSESSFVIAIDNSQSMEATDFSPNRLEAAKQAASEFVDSLPPHARVAVVSFSGNAIVESELTTSKEKLKEAIKRIELSEIGGTDINEVVLLASNILENEDAKSLVVVSDGRINVGTIDDAVERAEKNDLIVHTIGIGTREGGQVNYGLSKIDEDSLKALAYNTGGRFFMSTDLAKLKNSFQEIVKLKLKRVTRDYSRELGIAALVLFIIYFVLSTAGYKVLP
ncbi:VWA domain-containing protein [Candidatus Pacearchaeota archaeon]|nr:MAG: VWA domain-containing protein [Candidatus Pacearchaeota archaeon]